MVTVATPHTNATTNHSSQPVHGHIIGVCRSLPGYFASANCERKNNSWKWRHAQSWHGGLQERVVWPSTWGGPPPFVVCPPPFCKGLRVEVPANLPETHMVAAGLCLTQVLTLDSSGQRLFGSKEGGRGLSRGSGPIRVFPVNKRP